MGGYFSNRWNWHSTKPDADPLCFVDVRYLARHGFFAAPPDQWRTFTITCEPTGSIEIHVVGVEGGQPPEVELDYRFRRFDSEPWTPVRERIKLDLHLMQLRRRAAMVLLSRLLETESGAALGARPLPVQRLQRCRLHKHPGRSARPHVPQGARRPPEARRRTRPGLGSAAKAKRDALDNL